MISVLIADDHPLLREGVAAIIRAQQDMRVVCEAADADSAVDQCMLAKPDVAIVDLIMPGRGITAIERIARANLGTRVIALTVHDEPEYLRAVLAAGGSGYVVKGAPGSELVEAIRAVSRGESYIRVRLGDDGLREVTRRFTAPSASNLSLREREVLVGVARGFTSREVAERLGLKAKTVETYRARLQDKLGATNRAALVAYAIRSGLLKE